MRTVFTSHGHDSCSVRYQNRLTNLIENRTFIREGHYVFEIGFNGYEVQLCKGLSISGITLMTDESIDLIDIIRKEYTLLRRIETRILKRF